MANMQSTQGFLESRNIPEQDLTQISLESGGFWGSFDYTWISLPFLDENGNSSDWMEQPFGSLDTTQFQTINTEPLPDQYLLSSPGNVSEWPSAALPSSCTPPIEMPNPIQVSSTNSDDFTSPHFNMSPRIISSQSPQIRPPSSQIFSSSPPRPPTLHTCTICQPNKSYTRPQLLKRHLKTHAKPVACLDNICTHRFAENRDMRRHVSVHHPTLIPPPLHLCPTSGCRYAREGFGRRDNLMRHLRKVHGRLVA